MKKYLVILLLTCSFVLSSCSSIMNGSKSDVSINSTPASASITVDGMSMGSTPTVVKLKRGSTHMIEIAKQGYAVTKIHTENSLSGWFWGNILCGGILGIVIDLATGNAYDVDPDVINVTLQKSTALNEYKALENLTMINLQDEQGNTISGIQIIWE